MDRNFIMPPVAYQSIVALRKESVDRNTDEDNDATEYIRRSPQGERG